MAYHISLKNAEPTSIPIHHTFFLDKAKDNEYQKHHMIHTFNMILYYDK